MKTVKLTKDIFTGTEKEVYIPEGVIKEQTYDYQDPKPYYKYYYISKKGNKKECRVEWV